ncbi:Hypothetical predicted protein, partial [Pelobates cultripes]
PTTTKSTPCPCECVLEIFGVCIVTGNCPECTTPTTTKSSPCPCECVLEILGVCIVTGNCPECTSGTTLQSTTMTSPTTTSKYAIVKNKSDMGSGVNPRHTHKNETTKLI